MRNINSAKAFEGEAPKMPTQKETILSYIAKANYPVSREMLANWTGFKHNVITARLHSLVNDEVRLKENPVTISASSGYEVVTYSTFSTPEERIEQIYKFRRNTEKKLNDLINDYQDGVLHGYTLEMVEKEKERLEKYIKKLDRL